MNSPRMQCTTPHHKHDWEMGDYPDDWRCGWCGKTRPIKQDDKALGFEAAMAEVSSRLDEVTAERDAAIKERDEALAKQNAGIAALATRLNLALSADFDPYYAIGLDIGRLQDTEQRWCQACAIATEHCPIGLGLSHIRDGIPALAKRAEMSL